mmetsp:Transcript_38/g.139  ORF Transcript_38/g.139 Transcript_38/m.139 type:complete len:220 (-) Transcript_38:32-691(-)
MASRRDMQQHLSMGGFRGMPESARVRPSGHAGVTARERAEEARARREEQGEIPVHRRDEHALRMATVPLEGWEREKEKRVKKAFNRIVEKEWFDQFEGNLKLVEQIHVNAVREHFAMRRDRIKTPDVKCRKGGNTISREDWARNVEALNYLDSSTNVGTFFRGLAGKQRAKRLAAERSQEAAAGMERAAHPHQRPAANDEPSEASRRPPSAAPWANSEL